MTLAGIRNSLRRDPLQLQFLAAALLFVLLFVAYSWESISTHRSRVESELDYVNRLFVESTRSAFSGQHTHLTLIGEQLRRLGAMEDPERGRAFLEEILRDDTGTAAYGLARADGQLVLVSGVLAGEPLPNLMAAEETRDSFQEALHTPRLSLGRPYVMPVLRRWVMPMRVALREPDGSVAWVMTAGQALDGGDAAWWTA